MRETDAEAPQTPSPEPSISLRGGWAVRVSERLRTALCALWLCAALWPCALAQPARAERNAVDARDQREQGANAVYARVIVEKAALRTGPGATFRLVRTADQGETFPVHERAPRGFWLRVELPDGSSAYVQGDAVYVHEVGTRSRPDRVLGKLFAPPPLLAAHGEVAVSLGALSQSGFMALRPTWLLGPSFGFEGTLGAAVGSTGRIFLGSVGGIINLFPSWPVVPFVVAGGGGLYAAPNADSFVLEEGTRSLLYGGGGLRFGFRRRIILRVEARGYAFFEADQLLAQQEISGGFSAFF